MNWKNTVERFGAVAKGFHWIVAVAVIGLIALGLYMEGLDPSPAKFSLYFWHKSIGIAVLALVVLRLFWRFVNARPAALAAHKKWEKILAKIIHFLLYACLFVMPLSGWSMSSAKGFSVSVFGWFTLPDIVGEDKELGRLLGEVHEYTGYALIVFIVLHFGGALKHHFIDRDSTLRRMLPFAKVALAFVFIMLLSGTARASDVPTAWTIDPARSRLVFEGTQMGAPFTGEFRAFGGAILFDPEKLGQSMAVITIDMTSFDTASSERDGNLKTEPWFFTESFPESTFRTESFEKAGDDKYIAHGKLTIRDVTLPVDLPFTLTITTGDAGHKTAQMEGEVTLQRLDYNIGTGEWKDTSSVGNPVKVRVFITASAFAPPQ